MKRGEVWTVAGGGDYTGKARPVVIVQDDRFEGTDSVTVCALTSAAVEAPLLRIAADPTVLNGLDGPSQAMVDKVTTVRRKRLDRRIGVLALDDLSRISRALLVFLRLAG